MGRRKTVITISSSSDEENDSSLISKPSGSARSRTAPPIKRPNPRFPKKPRLSGPPSSLSSLQSDNVDSMRLFCEDFEESFHGFNSFNHGNGKGSMKELWVDKHKPRSTEALAVHKKKVEEVKMWIEDRLKSPREKNFNQVLIITGQAGVGKSATIQVIASHLGATLWEWSTPTPTVWQEHVHNLNSGIRYTSKLDEFENFVERIRKYGFVSSSRDQQSQSSVILIDDLPVPSGRSAYGKLLSCLQLLVQSTNVPTVILITDCGKVDSVDNSYARYIEELQQSLENAGACKVSFNPITNNSIKKTLSRICALESYNLNAEHIDLIAKASGGDIRHAISSLQYFCLRPDSKHPILVSNSTMVDLRKRSDGMDHGNTGLLLLFGRDETLSLFHALGKFLHNKRDSETPVSSEKEAFLVSKRLSRLPLKMDVPEKILSQAHGQARPVADFLHENDVLAEQKTLFPTVACAIPSVLDFLDEEAIDDASSVASYLSDADVFLGALHAMRFNNHYAENIAQSTAASVAARGVLFGNSHPLSSRWHSIRRPKLWQVEQSSLYNKHEMLKQKSTSCNSLSSSDIAIIATEHMPVLKWLRYREPEVSKHNQVQMEECETSPDDEENEVSEDEIEEW